MLRCDTRSQIGRELGSVPDTIRHASEIARDTHDFFPLRPRKFAAKLGLMSDSTKRSPRPPPPLGLGQQDIQKIAAEACCDMTTVRKYLAGGTCYPSSINRITRAAAKLGIKLPPRPN